MASTNKTLSVTIPAELSDAIRALAERERRNLGQQVTILLEGAMRLRAPKGQQGAAILQAPPLISGESNGDAQAAG